MKKIVLAIAAVGVLFLAPSCKKCKDCTQTTKQNGVTVSTQSLGEVCDDDLEEIDGETYTQTITDPFTGDTYSQEVSYDCN